MNTPMDDFTMELRGKLENLTVTKLKHLCSEMERLGMGDYSVKMFPDEDVNSDPVDIGFLEIEDKVVAFSI